MKRSRLPLTALRTFEAAGRQQSFKRAAEELTVSEAAVSRQIRDLERLLGIALFHREHRAVRLTNQGQRLFAKLSASFDTIDSALTELTGESRGDEVVLSVEPTFASVFLIPRLGAFSARYPDVEVRIDSSDALADLRSGRLSLAIRHSALHSTWPNVEARRLCDETLTPMASPTLTLETLRSSSDLLNVKLLRDETSENWERWLARARVAGAPVWGPIFSNAAVALQSAELGQGAVLGSRRLCRELLAAGRLYAPFDLELENGAYWLVARDFSKLSAGERLFGEWLTSEITLG